MKKLFVFAFMVAFLAAGAAVAQTPPQQPPHPEAVLAAYLHLTADQIAAWRQIGSETAAAVKPLAENEREIEKQLRTALQASTPDAAAVGALVISADTARDQIRALHEGAEAKRVALLTPDQKVKFDAFEAAAAFIQQHSPRP